jgi:hypothetical protein
MDTSDDMEMSQPPSLGPDEDVSWQGTTILLIELIGYKPYGEGAADILEGANDIFFLGSVPQFTLQFRPLWWTVAELKPTERQFLTSFHKNEGWRGLMKATDHLEYFPRSYLVGESHVRKIINSIMWHGEYMVLVEVESIVGVEALGDKDISESVRDFLQEKEDWNDVVYLPENSS